MRGRGCDGSTRYPAPGGGTRWHPATMTVMERRIARLAALHYTDNLL
jgi:hypothetical protein